MNIAFTSEAFAEFHEWAVRDKQVFKKLIELITAISREPFTGLGKPEPLKYDFAGCWSRHITDEHRIVYKVEADRYDQNNFSFVADDFKPSRYIPADLFEAVTSPTRFDGNYRTLRNKYWKYMRGFVSDVVFEGQEGTNIWFTTEDRAISQTMNISARSGLTPGQKVRVYCSYQGGTYKRWDVHAIEYR
jgi:toxin YoeB